MKRIIIFLIFTSAAISITAQRITCDYNNVSLSEALRQLNEQTEEYTISFLYKAVLIIFRIVLTTVALMLKLGWAIALPLSRLGRM